MATYESFSGVDSPWEAFGLKGVYIPLAIGVVIGVFLLAVIFSNTSVSVLLVTAVLGAVGLGALSGLICLSRKLGLYGLMKMYAIKSLPVYIKNNVCLKMQVERRSQE